MATTDPCTPAPSAFSPSYAAFWAAGLMVSTTLPPLLALPLTRSTRRLTKSRSSSPDRKLLSARSIPVSLPKVYHPVIGAYMNGCL
jgi:hypothetical protein